MDRHTRNAPPPPPSEHWQSSHPCLCVWLVLCWSPADSHGKLGCTRCCDVGKGVAGSASSGHGTVTSVRGLPWGWRLPSTTAHSGWWRREREWSTRRTLAFGHRSLHSWGSGQVSPPEPEPLRRAVTDRYVAAQAPLLVVPSMAGGDNIDGTTLRFLLEHCLKMKVLLEEEEKRKEEEKEKEKALTARARSSASLGPKRSRKKRRKKKAPRGVRIRRCGRGFGSRSSLSGALCSLWLSAGLRCLASWPVRTRRTVMRSSSSLVACLAGAVFLSLSSGPRCPTSFDQKDSFSSRSSTSLSWRKGFSHVPVCSADHGNSPVARGYALH